MKISEIAICEVTAIRSPLFWDVTHPRRVKTSFTPQRKPEITHNCNKYSLRSKYNTDAIYMPDSLDKNKYIVIIFVALYILVISSYGAPWMRCGV